MAGVVAFLAVVWLWLEETNTPLILVRNVNHRGPATWQLVRELLSGGEVDCLMIELLPTIRHRSTPVPHEVGPTVVPTWVWTCRCTNAGR